jgi:tetratricopeptide (TPR) repeat protein
VRSARVVWPLALLVLFLGTFRRTPPDASAAQAGDVDPTDVAVLTDLGDSYLKAGRVDLAEQAYRRALALDPRDGDVHVRLGELLLDRGDRGGASAEAESALRWHPASTRAVKLAERCAPAAGAIHDQ